MQIGDSQTSNKNLSVIAPDGAFHLYYATIQTLKN